MKKLLSILTALCILPLCASAQWYLFPGNKKTVTESTSSATAAAAKVARDTVATKTVSDSNVSASNTVSTDEDAFVLDIPDVVNVTLALPVGAAGAKPSNNFLNMYSGALMAVRDLASEGMKINLQIVDTREGAGLTGSIIQSSDVLIGPVSYDDVLAAAKISNGKAVVSPLEPKTAALVDSLCVVQSPASWSMQVDELIDWLENEVRTNDEIIVVKDTTSAGYGEQARYMMDRLQRTRLRHTVVSSLSKVKFSKFQNYRVLVASDRESFITSAVRAAGIEGQTGENNIALYCTAKVRSSVGSNVIDLHNASARVTASYFIDYDDEATKNFILAYRALFNDDPDQFAFQGYDTVKYYARMCARYGRQWYKKLTVHSEKGLQSDFKFSEYVGSGRQNVAVRRTVYNSDLSTTLK